jgi:transcriptional antiterminator RfaH
MAREQLERQAFETYLPQVKIQKRRKGTILSFIEPFFPRYLFVHLATHTQDWSPIRSTRGVVGLVKFEGMARTVPQSLIDSLKSNETADGIQRIQPDPWQPGDRVLIEDGPFAGYSCIYQAEKSADRVTVLLNIIGKQTRATLMKTDLQVPRFA